MPPGMLRIQLHGREEMRRFSVSSAYSLLSESAHTPDWPWKFISKTKARYMVTLFTCLVIKKACLLMKCYKKEGIRLSFRCFLCQEKEKLIVTSSFIAK